MLIYDMTLLYQLHLDMEMHQIEYWESSGEIYIYKLKMSMFVFLIVNENKGSCNTAVPKHGPSLPLILSNCQQFEALCQFELVK